jgi:glycosyltransferase involved in cell wall biosynthesis
MADVTAIILTLNEEKNIEACLQSIAGFCRRVVVIDSGSTDRTLEIAGQYGADVFFHEFAYYAEQYNWGVDNAKYRHEMDAAA